MYWLSLSSSSKNKLLVNYVTALGITLSIDLQAVAIEVPLNWFSDGVGALEEFGAFLLLVSTAVGIQVFVEEFPHVVGQAKDFQVFGVSVKWKVIIRIEYLSILKRRTDLDFSHCKLGTTTYWNPFLNFLAIPPKYSGSLMTSQMSLFWQSKSL